MSLKDTAARVAVLSSLADVVSAELRAAKAELQDGLKEAKQDTGTQKITVSLPDGQEIGTASLVQPKAAAVVVDDRAFREWVRQTFGQQEITSRLVVEVRPALQAKLLKEITAAGVTQWCDPETGELHDVPGVELQGRAAYTRMTVPDEGRDAIAAAWRDGKLAGLALPELTTGGDQ